MSLPVIVIPRFADAVRTQDLGTPCDVPGRWPLTAASAVSMRVKCWPCKDDRECPTGILLVLIQTCDRRAADPVFLQRVAARCGDRHSSAVQVVTAMKSWLVAHASTKVSIGICSSRPVGVPLSLR
ncbi:Uncharacterised protein [Mycobacterium tuberculosis]|nr:Uncharacterised protein [Mycobacterium tuberculosis]